MAKSRSRIRTIRRRRRKRGRKSQRSCPLNKTVRSSESGSSTGAYVWSGRPKPTGKSCSGPVVSPSMKTSSWPSKAPHSSGNLRWVPKEGSPNGKVQNSSTSLQGRAIPWLETSPAGGNKGCQRRMSRLTLRFLKLVSRLKGKRREMERLKSTVRRTEALTPVR